MRAAIRWGPIRSHVRALSLRRNHNAGDALRKNVIRTQIAVFACGPPSRSFPFVAIAPQLFPRFLSFSRRIGDHLAKLRNQIAIKTPANIGWRGFCRLFISIATLITVGILRSAAHAFAENGRAG